LRFGSERLHLQLLKKGGRVIADAIGMIVSIVVGIYVLAAVYGALLTLVVGRTMGDDEHPG
jgi:hypothetical protein